MFKKVILSGLVSGILAGIASLIYAKVYNDALGADFSAIATNSGILISNIMGCLVASIGYFLLTKYMKRNGEVIFNFLFTILSFATILGPFGAKLPLTVDMPELFPGLTVPMHFFPALAWFTLKPLFIQPEKPAFYPS